ncbi:non-specific serine/threonine protein kinase [Ranunculus cassubicifolius]
MASRFMYHIEIQSSHFSSSDLSGNHLSGQIPDEIGDCLALKGLDLSFNAIEGDIPFSISKVKQLETL